AIFDNRAVELLPAAELRPRLLHLPADARDVVQRGVVERVVVARLPEVSLAVLAAPGVGDQAFAADVVDETRDIDVAVMAVGMPDRDRERDRRIARAADQLD